MRQFCLGVFFASGFFSLTGKESPELLEEFEEKLKPLLEKYCYQCHGEKKAKAGIRIDHMDGLIADDHVKHWEIIRKQIREEEMPPEDEKQPTKKERASMTQWIDEALIMARMRVRPKNGGARRLTVAQYRNTLKDLLGIEEELTGVLPPDGISRDGFVNNGNTLLLSSLLVESYFDIAERALNIAILDEKKLPMIQTFRMDLGRKINPKPYPDKLILGANSALLNNDCFMVTELMPEKLFDYESFNMQRKFRFIEGYKGNDTVRGWRDYNSIYHAVFACMRGAGGYPFGKAYRIVPEGLLLRPAIPSAEVWGVDSTYGPRANFKISLRELPNHGKFQLRVKAAKYEDGLLLEPRSASAKPSKEAITVEGESEPKTMIVQKAGIYQADVYMQVGTGESIVADGSMLEDHLVGLWNFDGDTKNSHRQNELAGKLTGDAKFIDSPIGTGGQAISLDGNGDAVVVPSDNSMDVGKGAFTLAAWIRPTQLRQAGIVVRGKYGWTHGWIFDMPNNRGVLRIETSNTENQPNGTVTSRPGVIRVNEWQHVAAVVRRGKNQARLYVNGYEVGIGTIEPRLLDNPKMDIHIGRIPDAQQFKGEIDGVTFYKRALNLSELKALLTPGQRFVKAPPVKEEDLLLRVGGREFVAKRRQPAFLMLRLPAGPTEVSALYGGAAVPYKIIFTRLADNDPLTGRFRIFEKRSPKLGLHIGLRRDCGSTFAPVQKAVTVDSTDLREFTFTGSINNYPSPDVEKDNVNYLAGIREIGVRSEYTDGRDMPRLLIRSVEFEGPFYENWPPATHRNIFIESENKDEPKIYAREILRSFAGRAFRRPATSAEENSLMAVWKAAFEEEGNFEQSIKETLLTVLTSPQFIFLIEQSDTPEAEALTEYELASKLSYFLWNTAPDKRLLQLAGAGKLYSSLDAEITRLIQDDRFEQFVAEFASQWLSLDKFDAVEIDRSRFPSLTRDTRIHLRQEPIELLLHLFRKNLTACHLVHSDFIMANEVVASYYGLGHRTENGFDFVTIRHGKKHLGGLLSQTSILAGLSDGREANPVKRGAWLARKIIAEPPNDPPPNVPDLAEIDAKLPLRERLAQHRSRKACSNCHGGIDPWGIPLQQFDASGLFKKESTDTRSTLPDKTEILNYEELRDYLADKRMNRVVFSVLKHLGTYATGRGLTYNELAFLEDKSLNLPRSEYRMQDMLRFVIHSNIFLEK